MTTGQPSVRFSSRPVERRRPALTERLRAVVIAFFAYLAALVGPLVVAAIGLAIAFAGATELLRDTELDRRGVPVRANVVARRAGVDVHGTQVRYRFTVKLGSYTYGDALGRDDLWASVEADSIRTYDDVPQIDVIHLPEDPSINRPLRRLGPTRADAFAGLLLGLVFSVGGAALARWLRLQSLGRLAVLDVVYHVALVGSGAAVGLAVASFTTGPFTAYTCGGALVALVLAVMWMNRGVRAIEDDFIVARSGSASRARHRLDAEQRDTWAPAAAAAALHARAGSAGYARTKLLSRTAAPFTRGARLVGPMLDVVEHRQDAATSSADSPAAEAIVDLCRLGAFRDDALERYRAWALAEASQLVDLAAAEAVARELAPSLDPEVRAYAQWARVAAELPVGDEDRPEDAERGAVLAEEAGHERLARSLRSRAAAARAHTTDNRAAYRHPRAG